MREDAQSVTVDEDRAEAIREINLILARLPLERLGEVVVMLREFCGCHNSTNVLSYQ